MRSQTGVWERDRAVKILHPQCYDFLRKNCIGVKPLKRLLTVFSVNFFQFCFNALSL